MLVQKKKKKEKAMNHSVECATEGGSGGITPWGLLSYWDRNGRMSEMEEECGKISF